LPLRGLSFSPDIIRFLLNQNNIASNNTIPALLSSRVTAAGKPFVVRDSSRGSPDDEH
jgi:hypothetical protein